jgi:hypothetical protein
MAQVIKAWRATLHSGTYLSHGQSITVTVNITQEWEIQVQVGVVFGSNVSLGPGIFVYPSSSGANNFDTEALVGFSIATTASANRRASIRLTTGQYAIQVVASSPSVTVYIHTQEVITAIS